MAVANTKHSREMAIESSNQLSSRLKPLDLSSRKFSSMLHLAKGVAANRLVTLLNMAPGESGYLGAAQANA